MTLSCSFPSADTSTQCIQVERLVALVVADWSFSRQRDQLD